MSTRDDARLTAQERAALSNLEALAAADDPQLAARLRGPNRWRLVLQVSRLLGWVPGLPGLRRWVTRLLGVHRLWVAVPAVIVGLALMVVSVSVGLAVGVIGAGIAATGLWSVVTATARRWGGG